MVRCKGSVNLDSLASFKIETYCPLGYHNHFITDDHGLGELEAGEVYSTILEGHVPLEGSEGSLSVYLSRCLVLLMFLSLLPSH